MIYLLIIVLFNLAIIKILFDIITPDPHRRFQEHLKTLFEINNNMKETKD